MAEQRLAQIGQIPGQRWLEDPLLSFTVVSFLVNLNKLIAYHKWYAYNSLGTVFSC